MSVFYVCILDEQMGAGVHQDPQLLPVSGQGVRYTGTRGPSGRWTSWAGIRTDPSYLL